jgi:uncharacterized membrane protein YfcA
MEVASLAVLFVLGALLGALGGLLGIGGGLFAIPVLGLAFGLDQQHAQGTSLVMVVPNVAVGLWNYAKRGSMDPRIGLALALGALPSTIVGARVATHLPSALLRVAFAVFTLTIAAVTLIRALLREGSPRQRAPWPFATVVGAFGGVLSGLFGVGGAVFSVPLVSILFGTSQAVAQGFGLALVAPGTLAGIATYGVAGDVDWVPGLALAAGGIAAVPYGVGLAYRLPERVLRLAFAALMVASAVALLVRER